MLINVTVYALEHYAVLLGLGMLSYVIGRALSRGSRYHSTVEKLAFCTALGLGVIAQVTYVAGLLHLLYPAVILGALAIVSIAFVSVWRELLPELSNALSNVPTPPSRLILPLMVFMLLVPLMILPLYPPIASDATSYHLAAAKIYSQSHWVQPTIYLRFPVFPQTNEMLFTLMISIYDAVSAQLVQFLMMILVAIALYSWGSQAFSSRAGAWAAGLWLGNPMVLWLGASGYIDIGLTLFITMAVYAFWYWLRGQEQSWCLIAAVFCGFALGSKYSALFFMGFLSIIMGYRCIIKRQFAAFFIFTGIAVAVAAPWYLRNYYYTGNPVFPFFPEVFGYSLWTRRDVQGLLHDLLQSWGGPRTIRGMFLLPWNFMVNQGIFHIEARLSPVYALATPLLLMPGSKSGLRIYLLGLSFCYTVFWFFYGQILRYWLPVVPLLSLAISGILDDLLNFRPFTFSGLRAIRAATMPLGILLFISPSLAYATKVVLTRGPIPVTQEQRSLYLERHLITYQAYEYLNGLRDADYRLYALYDESMAFFAKGIFMGDWFGPARYESIVGKLNDSKAVYEQLRALGATHFLVYLNRTEVPKVHLPEDQFFQSHFKLIYADANVRLFELVDRPLTTFEGPELLRNPGYEDLRNHRPFGWGHLVYTSLNDDSAVWFDDLSFREKGFRWVRPSRSLRHVAVE